MANWQERIKQAFLIRETAERQKAEDEHRKKTEEEIWKKGGELKRQQNLEKAKTVIENIGAHSILERAKEVWGAGRVFEEIDKDGCGVRAILEVQYDGYFSESGGSDYSYVPQTYKGKWRDRWIIDVESTFITVIDRHEFTTPGQLFHSDKQYPTGESTSDTYECGPSVIVDFNNYTKTRGEVEEIILKFCERRIASKTLPLDYKRRWVR